MSELLHAIRNRSANEPSQYCVFVDEFQNFASSDDFRAVITEGRKFGSAITFGHQERYGQFAENQRLMGATLAAVNKVLFQVIVPDAEELAPEFSKASPTEIRFERQLVLSQEPIADILKGHANPEIQRFVTEYFRNLLDRLEDTKEAMELERILRQEQIDYAQTTRGSSTSKDSRGRLHTIYHGPNPEILESVREHTEQLIKLYESSQALRLIIRSMDAFLVALMEGRVARGQEAYVSTLRDIVAQFYSIPRELDLYIALTYGDTRKSYTLSHAFAKQYGLFRSEVQAIEQEVADKNRQIRQGKISSIEAEFKERNKLPAINQAYQQDYKSQLILEDVKKLHITNRFIMYLDPFNDLLDIFIILLEYPTIKTMLSPYFTARFKPPWHNVFYTIKLSIKDLLNKLNQSLEDVKTTREIINKQKWWRMQPALHPKDYAWRYQTVYYRETLLESLKNFIQQYGEGILVVFALLRTAANPGEWRFERDFSSFKYEGPRLATPEVKGIVKDFPWKQWMKYTMLTFPISEFGLCSCGFLVHPL